MRLDVHPGPPPLPSQELKSRHARAKRELVLLEVERQLLSEVRRESTYHQSVRAARRRKHRRFLREQLETACRVFKSLAKEFERAGR